MQCTLCGYKFDETKVEDCGCSCAFGGCNGNNVRCPNCGHDMPNPNKRNDSVSLLTKLKKSFKQEN
ncbi:MAG: hypothetical protein LUG89_01130 [Methanosphaera sp.]|nr:hypothetical protein [Methanosphaera sp.]